MSASVDMMGFAQSKGVGKIGETLHLARVINDEWHSGVFVFLETRDGRFGRTLSGRSLYETVMVEIQFIGDSPVQCHNRLREMQRAMEGMKWHKEGAFLYESVLAQSPPKQIIPPWFNSRQSKHRFLYAQLYRVMRKYLLTNNSE